MTTQQHSHIPAAPQPFLRFSEPMRFYDTVEVKVPNPGSSVELFCDLTNKGSALTNFRIPQVLPTNVRFSLENVTLEVRHWSGDNMDALVKLLGRFELRINAKLMCQVPLRDLVGGVYAAAEANITDRDVLSGCIGFDSSMPWAEPKCVELAERIVSENRELLWPLWLKKLDKRFGPFLPEWRHLWTTWTPVERPRTGTSLVTVYLNGRGERVRGL